MYVLISNPKNQHICLNFIRSQRFPIFIAILTIPWQGKSIFQQALMWTKIKHKQKTFFVVRNSLEFSVTLLVTLIFRSVTATSLMSLHLRMTNPKSLPVKYIRVMFIKTVYCKKIHSYVIISSFEISAIFLQYWNILSWHSETKIYLLLTFPSLNSLIHNVPKWSNTL